MPSIFEKFYPESPPNIVVAEKAIENSPMSKKLFKTTQADKQSDQNMVFDMLWLAVLDRFEEIITKIFSILPPNESERYMDKFKVALTFTSRLAEKSYRAAVSNDETFLYLCDVTQSVEKTTELINSEADSVVKFFCGRLPVELKKHFELHLQESVLSEDLHESPRLN